MCCVDRLNPPPEAVNVTAGAGEHGSNENTNGLLRQYLPKGLDISGYPQASLDAIARKLNERPRKTLGFRTPADVFDECVASID